MSIPSLGLKYLSGAATNGNILLALDDDSIEYTPLFFYEGVSYVDNGDGTATLTIT
jgi:hypothetical protein